MGRTLLAFIGGMAALLLVLGLMIFSGVNWQTSVDVVFIFGTAVTVRLVVLLVVSLGAGMLLGVGVVLRSLSLGRQWRRTRQLKKAMKAARTAQPQKEEKDAHSAQSQKEGKDARTAQPQKEGGDAAHVRPKRRFFRRKKDTNKPKNEGASSD